MSNCVMCDKPEAKYLTIKNGREISLCLECVTSNKTSNIWDNPEFWSTQIYFEE